MAESPVQRSSRPPARQRDPVATRRKLIAATRDLVLVQGFNATGVDQVCRQAGVTKGAFFHHFKSKQELGHAVLADWAAFGSSLYAAAEAAPGCRADGAAQQALEPIHRLLDIMAGFVADGSTPVTCVVGIMSQELALADPELRHSCSQHLGDWTAFVQRLLEQAKAAHPTAQDVDCEQVAWFLNCLWQGSMLVAKTRQQPEIIIHNLKRARDYVDQLFQPRP